MIEDFTYYYYGKDGELKTAPTPMSVPEEIEDYANANDAVSLVQKLGCIGRSHHSISSEYHRLCLDVLKIAVEKHGEVFPMLLRGTRSDRPDTDHKILFGTTNKEVAQFYGEIREYQNIRGLKTRSTMKSVISDDLTEMDEEIIFFPSHA